MDAVEARNMVHAMSRLYLDDQGRTLLGRLEYFANQPAPDTVKDIRERVDEISTIKRDIDENYEKWVQVPTAADEFDMEGEGYGESEADNSEYEEEYGEFEESYTHTSAIDAVPVSMPNHGGAPKTQSWGPSVALAAITLLMAVVG